MGSLSEVARLAGHVALRMGWFPVLGMAAAAPIEACQLDRKMCHYVGRSGFRGVGLAVAVGTLSPLCSCGILPIVIPMAFSRVPLAPG